MDGNDGWVRVHSDKDEKKSDEEFLVRNLLRELIEKLLEAPIDPTTGVGTAEWWADDPGLEALVEEYAEKIAAEYEDAGISS